MNGGSRLTFPQLAARRLARFLLTAEHSMPGEVDRLLFWMDRVERLEADLRETHPAMHGLICAKLASAQRTEHAALTGLICAARRGDPEAIVALAALESETKATWARTRTAA